MDLWTPLEGHDGSCRDIHQTHEAFRCSKIYHFTMCDTTRLSLGRDLSGPLKAKYGRLPQEPRLRGIRTL